MGLLDFAKGAGKAVANVAKAGAWVADPHHYDDIAEGVGKVGEYVAEHPGQTWDTGFEVGRAVLKDQLKPQNLAINAALLGATVATGGLAGGAWAAKLGLGARSVEAGLEAAKIGETVGTAVKAAKVGETAVEAAEVGATASRTAKFVQGAEKVLGTEPGRFGQVANRVLNPLGSSKYGAGAIREGIAEKVLASGGEAAPSTARQITAAVIQGSGKGAGAPSQMAGMGDEIYKVQRGAWNVNQAQKRVAMAGQVTHGVEVAADPQKAIRERANEEINARTTTAAYTDRGQTSETLYDHNGNPEPTLSHGYPSDYEANRQQAWEEQYYSKKLGGPAYQNAAGQWQAKPPLSQPASGQAQSPYNGVNTSPNNTAPTVNFTGGGSTPPGGGPPSGGGPPAASAPGPSGRNNAFTSGTMATATPQSPPTTQSPSQSPSGGHLKARTDNILSNKTQHFWEGTRRQAFSGIDGSFDWRTVEPLNNKTYTYQRGKEPTAPEEEEPTTTQQAGGPQQSGQGSGQPGSGQAPNGTSYPTMTELGEGANKFGKNMYPTVTKEQAHPYGQVGFGDSDFVEAEVLEDKPAIGKGFAPLSQPSTPLAIGMGTPTVTQSRTSTRKQRQSGIGPMGQRMIDQELTAPSQGNSVASMMGQTVGSAPDAAFDFSQIGKQPDTGIYQTSLKKMGTGPR